MNASEFYLKIRTKIENNVRPYGTQFAGKLKFNGFVCGVDLSACISTFFALKYAMEYISIFHLLIT